MFAKSEETDNDEFEPSSSQEVTGELGDCQVCGNQAHGIHFGVLSCRACAAFFRRTTVLGKKYVCRRANKQCDVTKSQRYICRLCRYEKCLNLGMTPDNVQWNRDSILSVEGRTAKRKVNEESSQAENVVEKRGCPPIIVTELLWQREKEKHQPSLTEMLPSVPMTKIIFDTSSATAKIGGIFDNFYPPLHDPEFVKLNTLQRMLYGLRQHRVDQKWENLEMIQTIDFASLFPFFEDQMQKIAKWMMYSDDFRALSSPEKSLIYKEAAATWYRLERCAVSVKILGERMLNEHLMVVSPMHYAQREKTILDLSAFSDKSNEQIKNMFHPFFQRVLDEIAKPLVEMKVSDEEVVYMLCQVCWQLAGRRQGEAARASENFQDQIANDIHDYYVNDRMMPNYASRLIKLMGVVTAMQKINLDRLKVMELAMIFDVFKIELTDNTFFDCVH